MCRALREVKSGAGSPCEVVDMTKSLGRMLVSNPTPSPDASPLRVDPQKARELMIAVKERYERDKGEGRKWDGEEVRDLLRTLTTVYPGDEGFEGVWRVVGEEEMEGWDMEVSVGRGEGATVEARWKVHVRVSPASS